MRTGAKLCLREQLSGEIALVGGCYTRSGAVPDRILVTEEAGERREGQGATLCRTGSSSESTLGDRVDGGSKGKGNARPPWAGERV